MTFDKEEHRAIILELIEKAHFPGAVVPQVFELLEAIRAADVKPVP